MPYDNQAAYDRLIFEVSSPGRAAFSLAEADVLRKAVGKKDRDLIQQELGKFIEKSVARGYDRRVVEDIAAQIETFGRYGFNKSHSVAYSIVSYQTAYLKANYPSHFTAALLTMDSQNAEKLAMYLAEAREREGKRRVLAVGVVDDEPAGADLGDAGEGQRPVVVADDAHLVVGTEADRLAVDEDLDRHER